jgi:hypothetical protein
VGLRGYFQKECLVTQSFNFFIFFILEDGMKKQKKMTGKFLPLFLFGFFIFSTGTAFGQGIDWSPLPWGLNLEELNTAFKDKYKTGQIKEDRDRPEIDLQYSPTKSLKFKRGELVALLSTTDQSMIGHLFGYSYEKKFFGQVIFFREHPEISPETAMNILKEKYPQGRLLRNFDTTHWNPIFEFKSNQIYIFTTERGIFFYDPDTLEKIIKKHQDIFKSGVERYEEKIKEENPNLH